MASNFCRDKITLSYEETQLNKGGIYYEENLGKVQKRFLEDRNENDHILG